MSHLAYPHELENKSGSDRIPLFVDEREIDLVLQGGQVIGITVVGDGQKVNEREFLGLIKWVWGHCGYFIEDELPNFLGDMRDIHWCDLLLIGQGRMFSPMEVVSAISLMPMTELTSKRCPSETPCA